MNTKATEITEAIAAALEIPPGAYEAAESRYQDLGKWFDDAKAESYKFSPHIYPQGSFRMGTVIRPLLDGESYDLDLGCRLRTGISKGTHSQQFLKELVGRDLEKYRLFRQIKEDLEEKHRCWRLEYADELSFHMDVVPSIPEDASQAAFIRSAMVQIGSSDLLAQRVVGQAGAVTDNRHPSYRLVAFDWRSSNSEGYSLWFESRIRLATNFLQKRAFEARAARVDELPTWKWKSPLQHAVQFLKRHRDVMFQDAPDSKPISIVLTTLAAAAYQGEETLDAALHRILSDMGNYVRATIPRVPNPVNPAEDFADKWHDSKYAHLRLEENFWNWLSQARADFEFIGRTHDMELVRKHATHKFSVSLGHEVISAAVGPAIMTQSKTHVITGTPPKPWATV